MKNIKKRFFILAILTIVFLSYLISPAYAFFDNTFKNSYVGLQIGNWGNTFNNSYFTDFENFTNTNNNQVTVNIDGLNWTLENIVAGNASTDRKRENSNIALRSAGSGSLITESYLTGLKVISFYLGFATNTDNRGGYNFNVSVSDNGVNWTTILDVSKPVDYLTEYTIDIESKLASGLTLVNGATATNATPLKIKIDLINGNARGTRIYNIDDLMLIYS